jgi:DnaJ-class molecular chaperone
VFAAKNRCDRCGGKKTVEEKKLLHVQVTRGMKDNEKIIFQGEGDQEVSMILLYRIFFDRTLWLRHGHRPKPK